MNRVAATALSKWFHQPDGSRLTVLRDISLTVASGEFVAILGPSGGGKSTLLRLLAGILLPSTGNVAMNGAGDGRADVALMFQNESFFPWLPVWKNLTYSLGIRGSSEKERRSAARTACESLDLNEDVLDKYPRQLSGGQQRRVALGIALARKPDVLLLDEPTSQLDYISKLRIQRLLENLFIADRFTCILVTHDVEEAILLADRVLFLADGLLLHQRRVEFPRPRPDSLRTSSEFETLRSEFLSFYRMGDA